MTNLIIYLQYLELAEEFYKAFRDLPPNGPSGIPVNWPRYFALCHAIELALKAFLLANDETESNLKISTNRHNIKELMSDAIKKGLEIGSTVRSDIEMLTEAHQKFWPRYPLQGGGTVVIIEQLDNPTVELLKAVISAIRDGKVLHVHY